MTLKMAVLAPMPRVSVSTTMTVKPGRFINVRIANRVSCQKVSMNPVPRRSRHSSFTCSNPPKLRRAA